MLPAVFAGGGGAVSPGRAGLCGASPTSPARRAGSPRLRRAGAPPAAAGPLTGTGQHRAPDQDAQDGCPAAVGGVRACCLVLGTGDPAAVVGERPAVQSGLPTGAQVKPPSAGGAVPRATGCRSGVATCRRVLVLADVAD